MKKYFIAALALASVVACSKDDVSDPVLDSSKKSVSITIANMETTTRAEEYEGKQTPAGVTGTACTSIDDNFYFMFADATGNIITVMSGADATTYNKGSDGTYTFHELSEVVNQIAVVGNMLTSPNEGENISKYKSLAETETQETVQAEYEELVVYAASNLTPNGVCVVNEGSKIHEYPLYTASLTVAPSMSRIEIGQISCTDFATANPKYSHIGIESIKLNGVTNGNSYIHNFTDFSDTNLPSATGAKNVLTSTSPVLEPTSGVWSWNIAPQATSNMVTNLYVVGDGFTTQVPVRTVTIVEYMDGTNKINQFEAGVIYNLDIDFGHNNIDGASDYLCANVTVTIKPWIVKDVNVNFATN